MNNYKMFTIFVEEAEGIIEEEYKFETVWSSKHKLGANETKEMRLVRPEETSLKWKPSLWY